MSISDQTKKQLFSKSAGQCNICQSAEFIQMAHIVAQKTNGTRGNNNRPSDIDSYDNIILLCPNHHAEVDRKDGQYSVDKLKTIKQAHESSIHALLDVTKKHLEDLSSLKTLYEYMPINNFIGMAEDLPRKVSIDFIEATEPFKSFCKGNPHRYPFWDNKLTELWENSIYKMDEISNFVLGSINIENNSFCTMYEVGINSGLYYNTYINCDSFMVINKNFLSHEQINLVNNKIDALARCFIEKHLLLINYIRYNFP